MNTEKLFQEFIEASNQLAALTQKKKAKRKEFVKVRNMINNNMPKKERASHNAKVAEENKQPKQSKLL